MQARLLPPIMLKKTLILLIFATINFSCSQINLEYLENTWIPIDCMFTHADGQHSCNDWVFLSFDNSSLTIINQVGHNGDPIQYQIDDSNSIVCEQFTKAQIKSLNKNSLEIEFDGGYTYSFIPMPNSDESINQKSLAESLINNEWILESKHFNNSRWEFLGTNEDAGLFKPGSKNVFSLNKLYTTEMGPLRYESAFWVIKSVDQKTLLFVESLYGSTDFAYILIEDVTNNTISGSTWFCGERQNVILRKEEPLNDAELQNRKSMLVSGNWILDEFSSSKKWHAMSENFIDFDSELDSTLLIDSLDFVDKKIRYAFNPDGKLEICIGDRTAVKGTWELLKSGTIIKTTEQKLAEKNEPFLTNYILVENLTNNELVISREEELHIGDYRSIHYYFKEKYKNRR
ncbi:MAG: hypothetical protein MI975_09360 [Cytophagales bacterium]|nr:hypothetical protein [Cytophagales bacterium]